MEFDSESLQYLLHLNHEMVEPEKEVTVEADGRFDDESQKYLELLSGKSAVSNGSTMFDIESEEYVRNLYKISDAGSVEVERDCDFGLNGANKDSMGKDTSIPIDEIKNQDDDILKQIDTPELSFLPKQRICSLYCSSKCGSVWDSWTADKRQLVEGMFSGKSVIQKKNYLLEHLKKQKELGIRKTGFHLNGHTFCLKACSKVSGLSEHILKTVIKDNQNSLVEYVHGNKSGTWMSCAAVRLIAWMKEFGLQFGQSSPDQLVTIIPAHWSKKSIFMKYRSEIVGKAVEKSTFYGLLVSKFGPARSDKTLPWIRISAYSTHSICDTCLALSQYRRNCQTKDQIVYVQALLYKHKEAYGRSRIVIAELRQSAMSFPADIMMIMLDDMDNQKSFVPRILERGKALCGLNTLPSKVTGTITWSGLYEGGRSIKYFINHNQFPQNGNKTVSVIYRLLQDFVKKFKKLPKMLVVNCDNCWRYDIIEISICSWFATVRTGCSSTPLMQVAILLHNNLII